jgi:hypothetical protein
VLAAVALIQQNILVLYRAGVFGGYANFLVPLARGSIKGQLESVVEVPLA